MALVEVHDVYKTYHKDSRGVQVFAGVNLEIERGEYLALMGPSGSGKSTLLNMLAGLDQPDSGTVVVEGVDLTRLKARQLADFRANNIGFIFQFYNLLPVLTAAQNVELPLLLTSLSKSDRNERVRIALGVVGLVDRSDHFPRQLSGGEQQRVGIARAIVSDPTLILADEPTGDLDAKSADEILALLGELNKEHGKTILMVTHDAHAAETAHDTIHLDKGVFHR